MTNAPVLRKYLVITILLFLGFGHYVVASKCLLSILDEKPLHLESLVFGYVVDVDPLPDGYVLLLTRSAKGDNDLIVKVDTNGHIRKIYDHRGYGPGEIRGVTNIIVTAKHILAIESQTPFIHQFDHDLNFVNDHRLKTGGKLFELGKYIGVWALKVKTTGKKVSKHLIALYATETFQFVKYAFKIDEEPAFVHTWGGLSRSGNNTYTGIYSNEYSLRFFNSELEQIKRVDNVPAEVKKRYQAYKDSPFVGSNKALEWVKSWSKMHSVYSLGKCHIIRNMHGDELWVDFYSETGKQLTPGYSMPENTSFIESDGKILLGLKWKEDESDEGNLKYSLVRWKLNSK